MDEEGLLITAMTLCERFCLTSWERGQELVRLLLMSIISSTCFSVHSLFADVGSVYELVHCSSDHRSCSSWHLNRQFVSVVDALDEAEDDAVWDDEEGETEDAEKPSIDNEFETESKGVDRNSEKVNNQRRFSFVSSFTAVYLHTPVS